MSWLRSFPLLCLPSTGILGGGAYKSDSDLRSQMLNSFSKAVCEVLEKALNRSRRTLSAACSAHRRRAEHGYNYIRPKSDKQNGKITALDSSDVQASLCPCGACSDLRDRFHRWLYHQWLLLVSGHTDVYGYSPPELAHSSIRATALPLPMRSA